VKEETVESRNCVSTHTPTQNRRVVPTPVPKCFHLPHLLASEHSDNKAEDRPADLGTARRKMDGENV
jgi:hypothetical protein